MVRWLGDDVLTRVQRLQPLAASAGIPLGTLALAWVLQNPNVSTAIIGASKPEQIKENAKAAGLTLEDALLKEIDEILEPVIQRDPRKVDRCHSRP
jgi:aryl-alcohol dehydrogenase-like predicted oxidoreductase